MSLGRDLTMSRLGSLGGALGDPTRFSLYRFVLASESPLSAGEAAEHFGLHRTVARSHLEKLVEVELLQIGTRRKPGGGRPAKVYSAADSRLEIQLPPRRYETLVQLLLRLVLNWPEADRDMAERVGREFGAEIAAGLPRQPGSNGDHLSLAAATDFLEERGCRPRVVESGPPKLVFEMGNCVYREAAEVAPEIVCGLSLGVLCGLLDVALESHVQTLSVLEGDDLCRHEFAL